jgi:Tfp pilus assembly protein PilF
MMLRATSAVAVTLLASLAAIVLAPPAGEASERSAALVSRGLVAFHGRDYASALEAFDKAVAEDPNDAEALYYRGVTHGRSDDFAAAAADLRSVLASPRAPARARLELGYALFRLGRYEEARAELERAERDPALASEAALFLGVIAVRQGRPAEARTALEHAAGDPRLAPAAHFYQGVAAENAGDAAAARESLQWTATHAPNTDMGRNAARRADDLGGAETAPPATKRYELYGALGFEYDSNVVLAPSDDALASTLGIGDKDDGRATIEAGGRYHLVQEPDLAVTAGLEIFRSLHFDLDDNDLQDHRAQADVAKRIGRAVLGFTGSYDFYLRDTTSFLQEVSSAPWVRFPLGDVAEADVYYRFRYRDFIEDDFDGVLDGANHAAGARVAHYFGTRDQYVALGYRFDHESPSNNAGELFGYNGNEIDAEFGWTLPAAIDLELVYAFRAEDYADESNGRDDHEHLVSVALERQLTSCTWIEAAYGGSFNDSDHPFFEYDRHVGAVTLELRY